MMDALLDRIRSHRRRAMLVGIPLLANIVLLVVLTIFQAPALDTLREERRALEKQSGPAGRDGYAGSVAGRRGDLEKLRGMIPAKRDFPAILEGIMESASSCGVVMGPVAYKATVLKERKLLAYDLTLSVTGRYGAVKAFLFDLQILEGLSTVDGMTLTGSDPYAEKVTLDARLTVYLREDA